jgi:hypothetical protein
MFSALTLVFHIRNSRFDFNCLGDGWINVQVLTSLFTSIVQRLRPALYRPLHDYTALNIVNAFKSGIILSKSGTITLLELQRIFGIGKFAVHSTHRLPRERDCGPHE